MFGKRIREMRKTKNLTVQEIAHQTGIPISTYRSWEEGVKIAGETPYIKLSKAFGVTLSHLITGEKEEFCFTQTRSEDIKNKLKLVKTTIEEIEKNMTLTN